jgi:LysM repeat protein
MTYQVQPGDTLESIAQEYFDDATLAGYIASINNLKSSILTPGQELFIDVAEVEAKPKWTYITIGIIVVLIISVYLYYKGK